MPNDGADRFAETVWPLDQLLVYMTPSTGFGQRLRLETIDQHLGRLPLRPVLQGCAVAAHLADTTINDRNGRIDLARGFLPPGVLQRALNAMSQRPELAPFSSQAALTLALRALTVCSDDNRVPPGNLDQRLGALLLAIGDHLTNRGASREHLLLELIRGALFYRLHGILDWYSTAEALFFRTIPTLTSNHEYIDVAATIERHTGVPLNVFWALSACHGVSVMGNRKVQTFPLRLESTSTVDSRLVDKWLDLSILRLDTARSSAVADLNTGSSWSFTTFMNRPLVETSPGRYIPIRTQLVALKATTAGMYYTVFDLLKDADEDHLRWARFMGHVVEAHGHELLKTLLPNEATVTRPEEETRSQKRNPPKACDAMVEINGDVIALDFVHRNLTLLTQATGDIGDLETDLERAIQEKVVQIDATLERHLRADCGVDRIYPLVITGAPLPLNPMVSELLDRMIRATNPRVVTVDTRCRKVGVLELLELRMLLRTASQNGMSIADLLDRWYSTPLGRNNFRDWIVQTDLSVGRTQVDDGWEQRALAILE